MAPTQKLRGHLRNKNEIKRNVFSSLNGLGKPHFKNRKMVGNFIFSNTDWTK